eukprot:20141-Eustigmatos_ZCMA.PRE.1
MTHRTTVIFWYRAHVDLDRQYLDLHIGTLSSACQLCTTTSVSRGMISTRFPGSCSTTAP